MKDIQKAILALILANLIWGVAAPIFKWSLESTPPFTLATLRFGLASLIFLFFAKRTGLWIKGKDILTLIIMSFIGITLHIGFFFIGLSYTESINAPIIASSGPIFLILFGALFLKDNVKTKTILGALLGLVGVITIIVLPSIDKGFDSSVLGNIFLVFAMLAGVIYALLLKKLIKRYHAVTIAFWSFLIGTIGFTPMFFDEIQRVGFLPVINLQVIGGVAFGVLLSSCLAYFLFIWAIKKMPVEDVGLFTYIDPIAAILVAVPLLGEVPTIHFFMGSALVFLGIFIAEGRIHWHPIHKLFR